MLVFARQHKSECVGVIGQKREPRSSRSCSGVCKMLSVQWRIFFQKMDLVIILEVQIEEIYTSVRPVTRLALVK